MRHDTQDTHTLPDPLLKPEQVAKWLDIEESTLAAWRSANRGNPLPYVRVGRLVRYRPQDVAAYVESDLQAA